jgi:short-subunit dehydrogenase
MKETVLITGASSGIGLELAKCFAADHSDLVLVARNETALETLAAELRRDYSIQAQVLPADLAKPEAPGQLAETLKGRGITVDVLVNNAGFGLHGSFAELPLSRQLEIIQVNVSALVALTGIFLPGMIERRRGGILNVGSLAGFFPGPNMAIYYATKAFVMSFSEAQTARSHRVRKVNVGKLSAAEVAATGYADFRANKLLSVPGTKYKMLAALAPRLFTRQAVARISGHYNQLG